VTRTLATLCVFLTLVASAGSALSAPGMTGPSVGPVDDAPVKNYGIVRQGVLLRSGLPKTNDYAWLRQQGVKSIVNLTDEAAGEVLLKKLGFQGYLWLPMDGPPSDAQAEQFLRFVQDSRNWPAHVHCHSGKDRTGLMVALFRYAIDAWPLGRALEEAKLYRSGKALYPEYVEWLRRWTVRYPPGSHALGGRGGKNDGR
jgi:hypothetical protein